MAVTAVWFFHYDRAVLGIHSEAEGLSLPPSLVQHLYTLAGNPMTTVYVLSATRVAAVDGSLVSRMESVGIGCDGKSQLCVCHISVSAHSPCVLMSNL